MSEIRNIISNFFSRVNCDLEEKEHVIIVNNVPKDFENLYGKKSPYTFSFEEYTEIESTEIVTSSSYLLTAISDYLKNKTKTSILKITFDNELLNYLNQRIDFRDYKIKNIIPNSKNDIIYKLTFLTNLQYLNENNKLINTLYLHDGELINNFDIKDFKTESGDKSELIGLKFDEEINTAKGKIKDLIKSKIDVISTGLFYSLEKSKKEIDCHQKDLLKEISNEINKNIKKISELAKRGFEANEDKIKKLIQVNEKFKEKIDPETINREKEFQYENERLKHALNISSTLLNKTLIYYPIYDLDLDLVNSQKIKRINFKFNPLTKRVFDLNCESCGLDLQRIEICESNHLICGKCTEKCDHCYTGICKKCTEINCFNCRSKICENCVEKCHSCRNNFCLNHLYNDFLEDNKICKNCSIKCDSCDKYTSKNLFRKIDSKNLCPKCVGMSINFYD